MSATRCIALVGALYPDLLADVLLRVDHHAPAAERIAAGVYSADDGGDGEPLLRVTAPDGSAALDALDGRLASLARDRATALLLALGIDAAAHAATLAPRVDPQPVDRATGGGAVDLSVWVRRSDVAALCDREAQARGRMSTGGLAVAYVGGMVTSGLELPPDQRGRAQGSADEGDHPDEREAQPTRLVIGEGALCTLRGVSGASVHLGERVSVYGGDGTGLAAHDGQRARLVVEVLP